jgi:hypothetical protein
MTFAVYEQFEKQTFPVSLIDPHAFRIQAASTKGNTANEPATRKDWINDLGEDGYELLKPIPYTVTRVDDGDYIAKFNVANIGSGGTDAHDAYQALIAAVLDTFDILRAEQDHLGDDAAAQLETLNAYLVKTTD